MNHDPTASPTELSLPDAARTLLATSKQGSLATLDPRDGAPHASLVELLPTSRGDVIFFTSNLAVHTTNLKLDERASVLVWDTSDGDDILAQQRMTIVGEFVEEPKTDELAQAWVELHPGAKNYLGFKDFNFYRLVTRRARYIAGFGRMDWIDAETFAAATPDPIAASAPGIIAHMNEDHEHNLIDYARAFLGRSSASAAKMKGIDRYGFDVVVSDEDGEPSVARLMFSKEIASAREARAELVAFAKKAREVLGDASLAARRDRG